VYKRQVQIAARKADEHLPLTNEQALALDGGEDLA